MTEATEQAHMHASCTGLGGERADGSQGQVSALMQLIFGREI